MGNIIAIFSGNKAEIPTRWKLCDGSDNTPDLRSRFIKGASNFDEIGLTGDGKHSHILALSPSHAHTTAEGGSHLHTFSVVTEDTGEFRDTDNMTIYETAHAHNISAENQRHTHDVGMSVALPSYYVLCYIMAEKHNWNFPVGSIVMWTGAAKELLPGWVLCDGNNGTVDLRNRFIKGSRTKEGAGGSATHIHTLDTDGDHTHTSMTTTFSHRHYQGNTPGPVYAPYNLNMNLAGHSHGHTINSAGSHAHAVGEASNDPPYYKLAFIQRIF